MDLTNILFAKALNKGDATKEYVDEAIKALKGEVSADLDTLEELSKALGNDPDFFLSVKNELDDKITKDELDATIAEVESSRVEAENERVSAEIIRENAEQERVVAEAERANTFAGYEAEINQFKNEIVTDKDSATDNTKFAIGSAEQNLEVPSMEEFNQLKDEKLDRTPGTWPAWTADEKAQARGNIDAADAESVDALKGDLGNITNKIIGKNIVRNIPSLWASGSKDGVSGITTNVYLTVPITLSDFVQDISYTIKLFSLDGTAVNRIFPYIDLFDSNGNIIEKYYLDKFETNYNFISIFEEKSATYGYVRLNLSSGIVPSDIGTKIGFALGKTKDILNMEVFEDYSENIVLNTKSILDGSIDNEKLNKSIVQKLNNVDSINAIVQGYDILQEIVSTEYIEGPKAYGFYLQIPKSAGLYRYKCEELANADYSFSVCNDDKNPNGKNISIIIDENGEFELRTPLIGYPSFSKYIRIVSGGKLTKESVLYEVMHEKGLVDNVKTADLLFWGDSLTMGVGGNGIDYPKVVAETLGLTYLNCGVGGETANTIACRQGGNNIVLPIGEVNCTFGENELIDVFGASVKPLLQSDGYSSGNIIYINGEKCNLSFYNGKYTISGYTKEPLTMPTLATLNGANYSGKFTVIFVGQNGSNVYGDTSVDARMAIIDSMIKHLDNTNYLIMGLSSGSGDFYDEENLKMIQRYGNRFFNTRKELVDSGLSVVNLSATEQDILDIANNKVPSSLLSDGLHFNADGYTALGKLVANRIKSYGVF